MKKAFIKGSVAIAFLLGGISLSGCSMLGSMMGNVLPNEEPEYNEYNMEETSTELSKEEIKDLLQSSTLPELLVENVDQSVLEFQSHVYLMDPQIVEYKLYVVSDSNEAIAEEIKNACEALETYLASDDYQGEAICIVVWAESINCHSSNLLVSFGNCDYSYNYYGKHENLTIEDHVSHIEPYGIDDETAIYDENVDYLINQESYWNEFDVDYVNYDYFNL